MHNTDIRLGSVMPFSQHLLSPFVNNPLDKLIEIVHSLHRDRMSGTLPYYILCLRHMQSQICAVSWAYKMIVIASEDEDLRNRLGDIAKASRRHMVCQACTHLRDSTHGPLDTDIGGAAKVYLQKMIL